MKKLLLIVLLTTTASCVPKTITTTQGKVAYTADQIVIRVNELQNAAIQANSSNALDTNTTRTIVTWCVSANKTLATTPSGYLNTLITSWGIAKTQIKTTNPAIIAVISAVDIALGVT